MGQKVNPNGVRIGFNKGWTSHWFAGKTYAKALQEDAAIRKIVADRYHHSGVSNVEIFRNRGDLVITIHSSKPGIIIGRSGAGAQELRAKLERDVALLSPQKPDPDLVEEVAREVLGFVRPDDAVVIER